MQSEIKALNNWYGPEFREFVENVVEADNFPAAVALLVSAVALAEEVYYRNQKQMPFIVQRLYSNSLIERLPVGEQWERAIVPMTTPTDMVEGLRYQDLYKGVEIFKSKIPSAIRHRRMRALVAAVRYLDGYVGPLMRAGRGEEEITYEDREKYVAAHTKIVAVVKRNPPSKEELMVLGAQERGTREQFEELPKGLRKVYAAFVKLQGERFSRKDIVTNTDLERRDVDAYVQQLCAKGFLSRKPRQKYYSTRVLGNCLTREEAAKLLEGLEELETQDPVTQGVAEETPDAPQSPKVEVTRHEMREKSFEEKVTSRLPLLDAEYVKHVLTRGSVSVSYNNSLTGTTRLVFELQNYDKPR